MARPSSPETQRARSELSRSKKCRFVAPQRFRELLVSTRRLARADDPIARARGLLDPRTGQRFLVEEEKLFSPL